MDNTKDKEKRKREMIELLDKADEFIFVGINEKEDTKFTCMYANKIKGIALLSNLIESHYPELVDLIFMRRISQEISEYLGVEEFAKFMDTEEGEVKH